MRQTFQKARCYRSMLFVPEHKIDWMLKAVKYGADALIFDLEDSVELFEKRAARNAVASAIRQLYSDPFGRLSGCKGVERKGRVIADESGQLATGGARSSTEGGSFQSVARAG